MTLTPADRRVWAALACGRRLTMRELACVCGYKSSSTAEYHILRLEAMGVLDFFGFDDDPAISAPAAGSIPAPTPAFEPAPQAD